MKSHFYKAVILFVSLFFLLTISSCVTEPEVIAGTSDKVSKENITDQDSQSVIGKEEPGDLYSPWELTDEPLVLGSTESLEGPIMEFSHLFSLYFPLSGIEPPYKGYKPGEGTRWQVESEQSEEIVYFERALLSIDDKDNSWWQFSLEGNGYDRSFEFLVDPDWVLLEMRYMSGTDVKVYKPSVDDEKNLLVQYLDRDSIKSERVSLETPIGKYFTDFYSFGNVKIWTSKTVIGNYLRMEVQFDEDLMLTAFLIEEKKNYKSVLGSH